MQESSKIDSHAVHNEWTRESDTKHPASSWDPDLGCHIEPAPQKRSNRAKAEEAVAFALKTQQDRHKIKSNEEE